MDIIKKPVNSRWQGGLSNDELRAALESKLDRKTTYSDSDLRAFALGVEYGLSLAYASEQPAKE